MLLNRQAATVPNGIYGLLGQPYPVPMPHTAGYHDEALDWRRRVIVNGGGVSDQTLRAVSRFCYQIDGVPGLRSRFYRLSLFCGTGITAALVPLYRSTSLGGAVLGNATDTNSNFVTADYTETGSSGGLAGNGSTKYLDTGLNTSTLPYGTAHASGYVVTVPTGTYQTILGSVNNGAKEFALYSNQGSAATAFYFSEENSASGYVVSAVNNPAGHLAGVSYSASDRRAFFKGSQTGGAGGTNTITLGSYPSLSALVFARNEFGSASTFSNARLASYSFGASITASQMTAFYNAMQTFQTVMGRNK